jgi:hypothetical protein
MCMVIGHGGNNSIRSFVQLPPIEAFQLVCTTGLSGLKLCAMTTPGRLIGNTKCGMPFGHAPISGV